MKIAPTLVYAHKPTPVQEIAQGQGTGVRAYSAHKAWDELRALLAVARAAERVLRKHGELQLENGGRGLMSAWAEAEIAKPLARLSRASGARSSGKGRRA